MDSVNWALVPAEFNWMARDANGNVWMFEHEPFIWGDEWLYGAPCQHCLIDEGSNMGYVRGDCDWKESLVQR